MKKNISVVTMLLILIGFSSCGKHDDNPGLPRVPAPNWELDTTGKYPLTMTAVVKMPVGIAADISETDMIGAFCGDECRGLGSLIETGTTSVFFVLIHGTGTEQPRISFRYYSSHNSYLYSTNAFLYFKIDGNYGTINGPEVLDVKPLK